MNNSLNAKTTLNIDGKSYNYFSLSTASEFLGIDVTKLPCSLKVLLESLLRNEDGVNVKLDDIRVLADCVNKHTNHEISYKPARVLMQDFTGVPAVVDLASMRDYVKKNGGNPSNINPSVPVDLVIDHSVQVDSYGSVSAFSKNVELEVKRNLERYQFLKWGESSFTNFRELLRIMLIKRFSDKQLKIDLKVINYILARIERSFYSIDKIIEKIDNESIGSNVTVPFISTLLKKDAI